MSLSLDRMRALVRLGLGGMSSSDISDPDVDELLDMALWELEDKYPFHARKANRKASLIIGTYIYDLSGIPRLDAIESVAVTTTDGERRKLARQTRDWWDANFAETETGTPLHYMREDDCLFVFPIPDEVLPLEIHFRQGVASFSDGLVQTTGLPRNWDEIVVQGAIWRGHYFRQDYNQAREASNFQLSLIRSAVPVEAKEERDHRYARLNVLDEWPVEHEDE